MEKIFIQQMQIAKFDLLKNYSIGKRNFTKLCKTLWNEHKTDIRKNNCLFDLFVNNYWEFTITATILKKGYCGFGTPKVFFGCSYFDNDTECENTLVCDFTDNRNRAIDWNESEYEYHRN